MFSGKRTSFGIFQRVFTQHFLRRYTPACVNFCSRSNFVQKCCRRLNEVVRHSRQVNGESYAYWRVTAEMIVGQKLFFVRQA